MRVWTTSLLLLLTSSCSLGPEPEVQADPAAESSAASESGVTDDDARDDDAQGDDSNTFVPDDEPDLFSDADLCDPMIDPYCEPGKKCSLVRIDQYSDFVGFCVPIADETVSIGERCVPLGEPGHDNCEDGSVCWDIMNGEGTCLGFCAGTADNPSCEDGYVCNWGKSWAAGLCTPICDPLATSDCPETCGCYWANNSFFCLPRTSNLAPGEPCGFINDCAPQNLCVTAEVVPDCEGASCCATFCDLNAPSCATEGTSCAAFYEEGTAPPLYEHVGICILADAP